MALFNAQNISAPGLGKGGGWSPFPSQSPSSNRYITLLLPRCTPLFHPFFPGSEMTQLDSPFTPFHFTPFVFWLLDVLAGCRKAVMAFFSWGQPRVSVPFTVRFLLSLFHERAFRETHRCLYFLSQSVKVHGIAFSLCSDRKVG